MRDEELVKQIKSGNRECADELIERHYRAILRYCARHCCDAGLAEDLAQETFLRAFRDFERYDERGKFRNYLYRIAYHLCVDEAKRTAEIPIDGESKGRENADGEAAFRQVERRDEVMRLLRVLPQSQREAVLLRYGGQLSFREIAQITGAPVRTVQSRVRLALLTMRKESEESG